MNLKKNWGILVPIILLFAYLILRLIDQSQMISIFPIDAYANDYSSHITRLWFLKEFGLHNPIPYWYNGAYTMEYYPPFWYIFSQPIYSLTQNPQSAAFFSLISIYLLSFLALFWIGKKQNLSSLKSVCLFLFFFVNPIAIGYFLRLGKLPEMLGWFFSFLLFGMLLWYREHKIDWKFLFFIPIYSLIHYSHILVFIAASIPIVGLFLVKNRKEKVIIALSVLATAVTTSPFWLTFLKAAKTSRISSYVSLEWLLQPGNTIDKITSILIPLLLLAVFFFYFSTAANKKKELLFYSPILLTSVFFASRIAVFIPLFNRPAPDTYNLLLIFFAVFLFLKTDYSKLKMEKYIQPIILIAVISAITISIIFTPFFQPHTQEVKDTLEILKSVNQKFRISATPVSVSARAINAYAPLYLNLSTPSGWASLNLPDDYLDSLNRQTEALNSKNCAELKSSMMALDTKELLVFNEYCSFLKSCGFTQKKTINNVCLYKVY